MEAIENAAFISVGRAAGFASLAIVCIMFGLSFEPALAMRIGGALCFGVGLILGFYAFRAPVRPYRRTELWLILAKEFRPREEVAQKVIGGILRSTYLMFARHAMILAVIFLLTSLVLQALGIGRVFI